MFKVVICVLFIVLLLFAGSVQGNTCPVAYSETGSAIPLYENTSIYLKSENITTKIHAKHIYERTEYVLKNCANSTVNQKLLLPFYKLSHETAIPQSVNFTVDNKSYDYNWTDFYWKDTISNRTNKYVCVGYELVFLPYEEKTVCAEYTLDYYKNEGRNEYGYLTLTGTLWNHSIEYANFTYYISKDLKDIQITGLEGYIEISEGEYKVIHKDFYNWTPEENIKITWYWWRDSLAFVEIPSIIATFCITVLLSNRKRNLIPGLFRGG